ncbi:MAG: DMT family transporter [Proteobacteria bacterium]|nr:DMT family transporter [Pseudomonadota bacterium]
MTAAAAPASSARGIAYVLVATAILGLNDAIVKLLTAGYPAGQIMGLRGVFFMLPVGLLIWRAGGLRALHVHNPLQQALRAALFVVSSILFIYPLSVLPLATVVSLGFTSPLFVTALAGPMLGERVGWRRRSAVIVGFCGVLMIVRPGGFEWQWIALLPLGSALAGSWRDILTRQMTASESSVAMLFYSSLGLATAGLLTMPFGWVLPSFRDMAMFIAMGVLSGGAHFLMIEGFRWTEANLVAPFKYSSLIWGVTYGYLIWGDVPDRWTFVGAAVIGASGLYILHREFVRGAR